MAFEVVWADRPHFLAMPLEPHPIPIDRHDRPAQPSGGLLEGWSDCRSLIETLM